MKTRYKISILATIVVALSVAAVFAVQLMTQKPAESPVATANPETVAAPEPKMTEPTKPKEAYKGEEVTVANTFSIKVPNGWKASVSESSGFIGIMFARPNQLESLVYNAKTKPTVDYNGIPSWSGLTEHFFVRATTTINRFDPSAHREITSEPFTFDDGSTGTKYFVIKHADEANQYGGLQKDAEWQGRTYIYALGDKQIEAHLALYPSSNGHVMFYEEVAKTIKFIP